MNQHGQQYQHVLACCNFFFLSRAVLKGLTLQKCVFDVYVCVFDVCLMFMYVCLMFVLDLI